MKGPRKVASLSEILEGLEKAPVKAPPIILQWEEPPTEDNPTGLVELTVETRFPKDPWIFGVRYMTEIQDRKRKQEPDAKGTMVLKHPDADLVALAQECVVSPTWLHNEEALTRFKAAMPLAASELRRKLMLVAGLNGDFFDDYPRLTMPRIWLQSDSESANGSDKLPGPATASPPTNSSPTPSTISNGARKSEESVSPTISGS